MMAPGLIAAAVQIKRPDLRLLPIEETRFVDKPDHEPNTDQEAGKQNGQASRLPGSAIVMHQTEQVRHSSHLSHEKALTLQNRQAVRLPASAHECYRTVLDIERRGHGGLRKKRTASPRCYSTHMTVKAMAWAASRCLASLVIKGIVSPEAA